MLLSFCHILMAGQPKLQTANFMGFIELTIKPDSNLKGYLKEMSMLQCDMAHHVLSYLCSANWADL
jgi:hypothetical protein